MQREMKAQKANCETVLTIDAATVLAPRMTVSLAYGSGRLPKWGQSTCLPRFQRGRNRVDEAHLH
jgi:hypothetical protein